MLYRNLILLSGALLSAAEVQPWGQCGGMYHTGETSCTSGWSCQKQNDWYSQCLQSQNPVTTLTTTTSFVSTRPLPTSRPTSTTTTTTASSTRRPLTSTIRTTTTTRPAPSTTNPSVALCSQYAYHAAGGYAFLNNLWGIDTATGGSQCTYYYGPANGGGATFSSDWQWTGDQWTVKSYIYAERIITRRLVSQINSLPTVAEWQYNTTNIRGNVAYDIFTDQDKDHVNMFGQYEIMIWLAQYGNVSPLSDSGSPVVQVTLAGHTWNLYTGWNNAWTPPQRVYSFVSAEGPITSFSGDLMEFFRYLIEEWSFPAETQYMLIYQIGTEAFTGGPANWHVSRFQAEIN